MAMIFGVDSMIPANTRLTNGYHMYDWVMRMNRFPSFWGRTLTGDDTITAEELTYLREKNCKIALILRDLTETGVSAFDGTDDALRAVEAAKALGVPQNGEVALFAEIHPDWSINHNWMISFAQTLNDNGYRPGFIGNTDSSKNFNFDRQCSHYVQATADVAQLHAVYWATEPKEDAEPVAWTPFCPSALAQEDIGLWRRGVIRFRDCEVNETYAREPELLSCMW